MEIAGQAPMMLGVLWTFQLIAFALVSFRLYARLVVVQMYGWDDYLFGLAVAMLFIYNVLLTVASSHGLGQKTGTPDDDKTQAVLLINIAQSILNFSTVAVKLSIAVFLYRLVSTDRTKRRLIIVPAVIMSFIVTVAQFVLWFSCTPIRYGWDWNVPQGSCNDDLQFVTILIAGLAVLLIEVYYATFSWYLIRGLQMPKLERTIIGVCMSTGYISAVCSIWRLLSLLAMAKYVGSDQSYLYSFVDVLIWQAADVISQLTTIAVTVCRPLYKDWLNTLVGTVKTSVESRLSSNKRTPGNESKTDDSSDHSRIALQTIGGSSTAKGGANTVPGKQLEAGTVIIERSWKVESDSRTMLFLDDGQSEEHILGNAGSVGVEQVERQR